MDFPKILDIVKGVWSLVLLTIFVGFICWSIAVLTSGGENILNSIVTMFEQATSSIQRQE